MASKIINSGISFVVISAMVTVNIYTFRRKKAAAVVDDSGEVEEAEK